MMSVSLFAWPTILLCIVARSEGADMDEINESSFGAPYSSHTGAAQLGVTSGAAASVAVK